MTTYPFICTEPKKVRLLKVQRCRGKGIILGVGKVKKEGNKTRGPGATDAFVFSCIQQIVSAAQITGEQEHRFPMQRELMPESSQLLISSWKISFDFKLPVFVSISNSCPSCKN